MSVDTTLSLARSLLDDPNASPEDLAKAALQLARATTEISKVLDPLKETLRDAAAEFRGEESSVFIEGGSEGRVMITFPGTQTKIAKDFDAESAIGVLGARFGLYFDTKVTYTPRKNLTAMVKTASDTSEQDFVMRCVQRVEPTPRVSFKK